MPNLAGTELMVILISVGLYVLPRIAWVSLNRRGAAAHWLEHYIHLKPAFYVPPEIEGSDK